MFALPKDKSVAFVGGGSIAEALIKGILQSGIAKPEQIAVTNRSRSERRAYFATTYGVHTPNKISDTVAHADVIFLCTKPNDLAVALTETASHTHRDPLYISVVAGCSIDWIVQTIGLSRPDAALRPRVVRTMPNTSSAVLESATAYALNDACSEADAELVQVFLGAVGAAYRIEESLINAVTGLSGSGPAYVYYLVEALTRAGMEVGLDEQTAAALVAQTLYGAAAMLKATGEAPDVLRQKVTSPGGTTMAGLRALDQHGFHAAISHAVQRATVRAQELGNEMTEQRPPADQGSES